MTQSPDIAWPFPADIAEHHAHALLFSSPNGARYLYDSPTSSIHPWPWTIKAKQLDDVYVASQKSLPPLLEQLGAPPELVDYIQLWRTSAGAFALEGLLQRDCATCAPQQRIYPFTDAHPLHIPAESTSDDVPLVPRAKEKKPPPLLFNLPSLFGNLMLVVTDSCNLRCKYCMLGGGYEGFKPLRGKHMNWDTAKKAVDHFIALNKGPTFQSMHDRKINIAFFGGEPLLRGKLIKQVVCYAKKLEKPGCGYWIDFSMTSNLTGLTPEMARFLIEHEVGLQVSIDGPKTEHDKYRVGPEGQGSFDSMVQHLKMLYDLDENYFKQRVRCVVTLNGNSNLTKIKKFFESGAPHIPRIAFLGMVRDMETSTFHKAFPFDPKRLSKQYFELLKEYLKRKKSKTPVQKGEFLYHLFEEPLESIYKRVMTSGMLERTHYTGSCQPGRRFAVSTDGKFHICERINEEFPLGDVEKGIDWDQCRSVMARYYHALPDCDHCWARALCTSCVAHNCEKNGFDFEHRCNHIRIELAHKLRTLCALLEEVPDAFKTGDPLIDRHAMINEPS